MRILTAEGWMSAEMLNESVIMDHAIMLRNLPNVMWKKRFWVALVFILFVSEGLANVRLVDDYWAGFAKPDDYFDDERDGFSGTFQLDHAGVLIAVYRDRGAQFNPMFSAMYAVSSGRQFAASGEARHLHAMKAQLGRLLEIAKERSSNGRKFLVWEYDFDLKEYGLRAPWISGLAQARIAAAFVCAYDVTHDETFRALASQAMQAFSVPMDEGGVTTATADGLYFEEIAKSGFRSTKVLNGHLAALQVVWLWAAISGEPEFERLANAGMAAVRADLAAYDAGFVSWYDQDPLTPDRRLAPRRGYNNLHVTQMAWLYHAYGDPIFLEYALKFSGYEEPRLSFTASSSTNAVTNGPEKIGFLGYSNYWSSSTFPVFLEQNFGRLCEISEFELWGYTARSTPKDFDILGSEDGLAFHLLAEVRGNNEMRYQGRLPTAKCRVVRIVIYSDNGNGNTALSGIAFRGAYSMRQAISSRIRMTSLANRIFGLGFEMRAGEWIVVDNQGERTANQIWRLSAVRNPALLKFEWSLDLKQWHPLKATVSEVNGNDVRVELASMYCRYIRFTSPSHGVSVRLESESK